MNRKKAFRNHMSNGSVPNTINGKPLREAPEPMTADSRSLPDTKALESSFFAKVYGWMFLGLLVSAGVAAYFGAQQNMLTYFQEHSGVYLGVMLGQLALIFAIMWLTERVPAVVLGFLFMLFAGMMGFLLSTIVEMYTPASIGATFGITSVMFGSMAVIGFVTKKDLSSWGMILLMALIGLIIASIVNLIWFNEIMYWAITFLGIIIFCALTVYDMNTLKKMSHNLSGSSADSYAISGALSLYLNFVNLFLFLLRIFGSSK